LPHAGHIPTDHQIKRHGLGNSVRSLLTLLWFGVIKFAGLQQLWPAQNWAKEAKRNSWESTAGLRLKKCGSRVALLPGNIVSAGGCPRVRVRRLSISDIVAYANEPNDVSIFIKV